jgi:hypothetical protein
VQNETVEYGIVIAPTAAAIPVASAPMDDTLAALVVAVPLLLL